MTKVERLASEYADSVTDDKAVKELVVSAYIAGYRRHIVSWLNKER